MTPFFRWDWVAHNVEDVWLALGEHVWLTFLAVTIGFAISFPVGVIAYRRRRFYGPLTAVTGIIYTIPSLALFAFLTPVTGLTVVTAEIGLVGYTLLILIRNVVAGLDGVPDDAREAALGMGYTRSQLLWRIELPLALPTVLGGLRIATVTVIGLVTVTAVIGKGGLGYFILLGLTRTFSTAIVLGAVLSLLLAVLADVLLLRIERVLAPWTRLRAETA